MITRGPVLLVGAKSMRKELVVALRAKGLDVDTLACYETLPVTLDPGDTALLRDGDVIFIGAPSAWTVASAYVPSRAWVIVPGASTAAAVRVEHPNVIEGWGPHLRTRLGELSI
jgi:uroporphyrinogen-III synthase